MSGFVAGFSGWASWAVWALGTVRKVWGIESSCGFGDAEWSSGDADILEQLEDVIGHSGGQVDGAVFVEDLDASDARAVELCFVGDSADDIAGFYVVSVSDFESEGFHVMVASGSWAVGVAALI